MKTRWKFQLPFRPKQFREHMFFGDTHAWEERIFQ